MKKTVAFVVGLVVIGGGAYYLWSNAPKSESPASTTSTNVQVTLKEVKEDTEGYTIDAEYPQFGVAAVDAAIQRRVDAAITAFKAYPTDIPSVDSVPKNEQDISSGREYIGDDYISTSLVISEYTGGAHPNTTILGVNIDLTTGREVSLDEALTLIGKNLSQVAAESLTQLKKEIGDDVVFEDGAAAKTENYSTFIIGEKEVTFIFNTYQVASYASGPQEVSFPRVK